MMMNTRRSKEHFDFILVAIVMILAGFGVLCVSVATFSTSSESEDTLLNYIVSSYYGMRQALFFLISPIALCVVAFLPYDLFRKRSAFFYVGACGLLVVALVGSKAAGVKAWVDVLWGYTLQPSEFIKLACILVTAKYLDNETNPLGSFKSFLRLGILMGIPWLLTIMQGEMGSVIVMVFVFGIMMFFGGAKLKVLLGIVLAGVIALAGLYAYMMATGSDSYRLERILSFVNPSLVDESAVYQVNNAKIAIGSGGLWGRGAFVQGSCSQLDYVPEDWTDFISSSIGEAFGFVGCSFVIIMYLLLILRLIYLARYTPDRFGQMVIIGVMSMFVFHVFENVGMNTGLTPVTGIPLPFLSYGGSNLLTNMIGIGMVLNVVKNRSVARMPSITPQVISGRTKWMHS